MLVAGNKQGLNVGFGGTLAFSSSKRHDKAGGQPLRSHMRAGCSGRYERDARTISADVLHCRFYLDKVTVAQEIYCAESDSSTFLTTGATESLVMFRFLQ